MKTESFQRHAKPRLALNRELLLVLSVIIAVVIAVGFAAANILMSDSGHTESKYQKALAAEGKDICATPEGYTDEQWREHMGHHPDEYKDCLK